ncbi:probable serine/threonine-protein kinase 26 at C-terminar half [Coccomyxa sp. Obi]|nr:probable serine/threonine-protein kinase 26 at C-terminar half [Coccomyxa sp. Obi]
MGLPKHRLQAQQLGGRTLFEVFVCPFSQLEIVNKEIHDLYTEADNARQAYDANEDPTRESKLEKLLQLCEKDKELLLPKLIDDRGLLQAQLKPSAGSSKAQQPDQTIQYLSELMPNMHKPPPTFADLPDALELLPKPLPLMPIDLTTIRNSPQAQMELPQLVVSTEDCGAEFLARNIGWGLASTPDEHTVLIATYQLGIGLMAAVLQYLSINPKPTGNTVDSSSATEPTLRPDLLLFIRSVLMCKCEAKNHKDDLLEAQEELRKKMAIWSPVHHANREYMLCYAAAGYLLRFYAVTNGGANMKAISPEFDLRDDLSRLKVMHASLQVLSIILQQMYHQLPKFPVPLGASQSYPNSVIFYRADQIEKLVDLREFAAGDKDTLLLVYEVLLELPNGPGMSHPIGLIWPKGMPKFVRDKWRVKMPLGLPNKPLDLPSLRCCVKDILGGLCALHHRKIVHRDIRFPNILVMPGNNYVLIDFEHSGRADDVPPFEPLRHWAPECQQPDAPAPYTTAADIFSVGALMKKYPIESDELALSLCKWLSADDPAQRPSASEALKHAWFMTDV